MREPGRQVDEFAHEAIGAAIAVHRHFGPGFLESVYQEALAIELAERNIPFEQEASVSLSYRGRRVGEGRMDFLVGGCLVLELKTVDALHPIHHAQVINYLRMTGLQLGLLVNFNVPVLKDGIRRVALSS